MHGEDNSPLASSAFSSLHEEHCSGGHSHDHGDPCTAHSHTHSHQQTKAVINRLSRAIGHLESVKRMVENGEDCSQVLIQIAAVRSALSSTAKVILKDHLEISRRTGLSSDELITFQDTFVAKKIALSSDAVYLEKQQAVENGDSGWYMGDANDVEQSDDPDDYITLPLYKLLSYCPKAVSVLSLPVGTIAIIKDGEITNICDEDNNEVYAK